MKLINISLLFILLLFASCGEDKKPAETGQETIETNTAKPEKEVMLSQQQYNALDIKIDTLSSRLMTGFVEANGELEVPPQNEATITPVIGGNVANIRVIEGERVKEGSVLASIEHPDIIKIQTDFINAVNQMNFQGKEFQRQQKLYEAGVGSGETFQRAEAEFQSLKGQVSGLEAQLRQLNIKPAKIKNGNIQRQIPILSPIEGAVQAVNIKTGQFVQAQTNMFEIINTEHVHVDLLVFEKDVAKVEKGQAVKFSVESLPGTELTAKIISISQNFEQDPKALHVHAEIKNRPGNLVPGMYVRGKIAVDDKRSIALPEAALAKDGDQFYVFSVEEEGDAWSFKPVEVIPGTLENGWIEIKLLENLPEDTRFAYNNAYYLIGEMNKGDGGHSH
ncbi:efflux RND transporter periplasmic adaptor subunit [Salegentibacter sediminis]|uniref:efflux RND transporter periplasmic adaptor subunit n=1 Tax=Salegentibacter sediminis TaxID=1930251 RepID=UPI0009BD8911|nr:efflux RND transporter periplasmic adaptor subunit [Salegentibacter sediminis]